jgi:hypothetical protein
VGGVAYDLVRVEVVTRALVKKVSIGEVEGEMAAPVWNWLTGGSLWRERT